MRILTTALMVLMTISLFSQTTTIEGYIFESGNRGYLSDVLVTAEDMSTDKILGKTQSDKDGHFSIQVPTNIKVRLYAAKDMFDIKKLETEVGEGKSFVKLEMGRAPGYTFEVTLAEKKSTPNEIVGAITETRIEVYNNTTREVVMDLKEHDTPAFQLNLEKGNHYTLLIRKNGFLSKRMEAKVDVEGCILCFEGVGKVGPGVSDNLTENNTFGVLLANVELERIFEGKTMEIQNLYYDLAKWTLNGGAREELNKVITLMKDNPNLTLELGSHTDSRGNSQLNLDLSVKRAKSAVNYLIHSGGISKKRIVYKGYGEEMLLNKCEDGVECSEEEHAINRRTELKIVGITDIKEVKSLAQMKKEEQLEAEILELMDQEQVQAKDEEELKKIIAAKENESMEFTKEKSLEIQSEDGAGSDHLANEEVDVTEEVIIDSELKVEEVKEETRIAEHENTEDRIEEEIIEESEQTLPLVTDGIKVVLHQSDTLLEVDHFIHIRHRNAEMYKNKKGKYYYMIGGFKQEHDAFKFLYTYIAPDKNYNAPFVASFKEGKMSIIYE